MLFSCLGAIATLLLPAGVIVRDHGCSCYYGEMAYNETEASPPVVQLLRYALNLNLAATFAPDGQIRIHEGPSTLFSVSVFDSLTEDFDGGAINALEPLPPIAYCADWRDATRYPSPGECSGRGWAWEFLRRNEQYALLATWMNGLPEAMRLREEPRSDDPLEHVLCGSAPVAGLQTVADYRRHCRANGDAAIVVTPLRVLRYCWNVTIPLLPHVDFSSLSLEQQHHFFAHDDPKVLTQEFLVKNFHAPEFPFQKIQTTISSNEVLLKIDFNQNIGIQLEKARAALESSQRSYFIGARRAEISSDDSMAEDGDESFDAVPSMDNYIDSLQFQLRIFDAKTMNCGVWGNYLVKTIGEQFDSESNSSDFAFSGNPKTITLDGIRDWYRKACRRIEGMGYIELARFDLSTKDKRKAARGKKLEGNKEIKSIRKIATALSGAKNSLDPRNPSLASVWHTSQTKQNK